MAITEIWVDTYADDSMCDGYVRVDADGVVYLTRATCQAAITTGRNAALYDWAETLGA